MNATSSADRLRQMTAERTRVIREMLEPGEQILNSGFTCLETGRDLPARTPWDPDGFVVVTDCASVYRDRYGIMRFPHAGVADVRRSWRPMPMSVKVLLAMRSGRSYRFASPHIFSQEWISAIQMYGAL